ncbi:MAG: right-handed parallel beta-helix repeat-containing protein, partial [Candidatus Sumerlaeota bacterium]
NFSSLGAGAIENAGTLSIINCTITKNIGNGAIINSGGAVEIGNTIVVGNIGGSLSIASDIAVTSLGSNYLNPVSAETGIANGVNHDVVGHLATPVNPTLANNGGQTDTHTLYPNSQAVDAANQSLITLVNFPSGILYDQRSQSYGPNFSSVDKFPYHGLVDIGAIEADPQTITVNTTDDENDGTSVGGVSLRDAITEAAPDSTIDFSPSIPDESTIPIILGAISIGKPLKIIGPGARKLTLQGASPSANIFALHHTVGDVRIEGLSFVSAPLLSGGAISSTGGGNLSLLECQISGCNAMNGGAIGFDGISKGKLIVERCTLNANEASGDGGAIYITAADALITNSTLSGNTAFGNGGGIYQSPGDLTIMNSTITRNAARNGGSGGGIYANGNVSIGNTIFEGNTGDSNPVLDNIDSDDIITTLGGNYFAHSANPVEDDGSNGDQIGTLENPLQPSIENVLSDNGGPTDTHALLFPSRAIGKGNPGLLTETYFPSGIFTDQRGEEGVANEDVGAYQARPRTIDVNTATDENDGVGFGDGVSLREALTEIAPGGAIYVLPGMPHVPIMLGGTELLIDKQMRIFGQGNTVDGNVWSRVFSVDAVDSQIAIFDLTIQNGSVIGDGGGINLSNGELSLWDCTITGNRANNGGGVEIYGPGSTAIISGCTISDNMTNDAGFSGGIDNYFGSTLSITNSTIANNTASVGGGIVSESADINMTNCTVLQNTGSGNAGGLTLNVAGNSFLENNIIQLNSNPANPSNSDMLFAATSIESGGGNYIGIGDNSGLVDGIGGDSVGTESDPLPAAVEATLADNGGPTKTYYPLNPGPAIDSATATLLGSDQRGAIRPFGSGLDKGSVEWAPFLIDGISDATDCLQDPGIYIAENEGYLYTSFTKDTENDLYIFLAAAPGAATQVPGTSFNVSAWDFYIFISASNGMYEVRDANSAVVSVDTYVDITADNLGFHAAETMISKGLIGGRKTWVAVVEATPGAGSTIVSQYPGAGANVTSNEFLPVITGYDSCQSDMLTLRANVVNRLLDLPSLKSATPRNFDTNGDGRVDGGDVVYLTP